METLGSIRTFGRRLSLFPGDKNLEVWTPGLMAALFATRGNSLPEDEANTEEIRAQRRRMTVSETEPLGGARSLLHC